ncbi:MAG: ABC transporter ATP-binding protein [Oenococcus sp.]|uniref:ABC transporter ATP-binding protein n=1 Tax=Oenococcus TaxID=46254 RepID=UPI0021E87D96|nr:ABC transporter ATP-binding protein [Oenococcus kitaharae]MCV3295689.1 ABC transporter ATP-binding protein [Oenococcus kitaharae]
MTQMISVDASHVYKTIKSQVLLKDAGIQLHPGQLMGLIGPSGAGKTTLIKAIMGMTAIDSGQIKVLSQSMPNRPILAKIGYMAQSDALYNNLSGLENMLFFGRLLSLKGQELLQSIDYAAGIVNLTHDLKKRVSNYSGGMKRRLSLAIALLADPQLLILDEPTVGIDPALSLQIWQELNHLKKQGKSIIITTHIMSDAERCDYLALIREGRVITAGTPQELKQLYHVNSIEAVFLAAGEQNKESQK